MLVDFLSGAFAVRASPGLCTEAVLLRPLENGPIAARDLWRHGRVSKRAIKMLVRAASKHRLVEVDDGGQVRLLVTLPPIEPAACPPLQALVSQLVLELPHFPVPYGSADPTFMGRGQSVDWKRVLREPGSRTDGLPMTALLSQALVAFAINYERKRRGPIQWAANILRAMDDGNVDPSGRFGPGIHAVPNLQRLDVVTVGDDGTVRLTAKGRSMRDSYEPLCEYVETEWRNRMGSALIDEVADALAADAEPRSFPLIEWTGSEFGVVATS